MSDIPERTLIDRVTHYDNPRFSWDENRLFEGAYYPYIECRPRWSTWDWCPKLKRSVQYLIQRIIRTHIPFKNERARTDDAFCLQLCLGQEMVLVRKEILDTKESPYDLRDRPQRSISTAQRMASWNGWGSGWYGTD